MQWVTGEAIYDDYSLKRTQLLLEVSVFVAGVVPVLVGGPDRLSLFVNVSDPRRSLSLPAPLLLLYVNRCGLYLQYPSTRKDLLDLHILGRCRCWPCGELRRAFIQKIEIGSQPKTINQTVSEV